MTQLTTAGVDTQSSSAPSSACGGHHTCVRKQLLWERMSERRSERKKGCKEGKGDGRQRKGREESQRETRREGERKGGREGRRGQEGVLLIKCIK